MAEHIWYTTRTLDTLSIGILGLGDIGRIGITDLVLILLVGIKLQRLVC